MTNLRLGAVLATVCGILGAGCAGDSGGEQAATVPAGDTGSGGGGGARFAQTNLVADRPHIAAFTDPQLVNAWGVARDDAGLFWIADNGTGRITIVDDTGAPSKGEYRSDQFDLGAAITGIVMASDKSLGADFMVASEDGKLFEVNGDIDPKAGIVFADRSKAGAIYKGIAVETVDDQAVVLAADFHNARIDAFDARGTLTSCDTTFVDPELPAGYAPFNVIAADGVIYVAYAKQDPEAMDEVAGAGLGLVDVYDAHGNFMRRLATGGDLNAPWALARIANLLFVGNFGDGRITVLDVASGKSLGQLACDGGAPLAVEGLWGVVAESPTSLFVAAGPQDESHGLFAHLGVAGH